MSRILFATLGSLGDVYPLAAVAQTLRGRGHDVTFMANPKYARVLESLALTFVPLGSSEDQMIFQEPADAAVPFLEHAAFAQLDRLFDELMCAAAGADAVVAPYWVVPAHLVAESRSVPLIACLLSPAYHGADAGTRVKAPAHWHTALANLRKRVGLPRVVLPYTEVLNAPAKLLALFPQFLIRAMARGLERLRICGYPQLQSRPAQQMDARLLTFCDERTVTFSFGSYVDRSDAQFLFAESVKACRMLDLKCLYLSQFVGEPGPRSSDVFVASYIDHDLIFPHSPFVVHHGGLGTLVAACRHAKPMMVVPFLYDQPYHAGRMAELAGAPCVPAAAYCCSTAATGLRELLNRKDVMSSQLASLMAMERDGAGIVADEVVQTIREWRAGTSRIDAHGCHR